MGTPGAVGPHSSKNWDFSRLVAQSQSYAKFPVWSFLVGDLLNTRDLGHRALSWSSGFNPSGGIIQHSRPSGVLRTSGYWDSNSGRIVHDLPITFVVRLRGWKGPSSLRRRSRKYDAWALFQTKSPSFRNEGKGIVTPVRANSQHAFWLLPILRVFSPFFSSLDECNNRIPCLG